MTAARAASRIGAAEYLAAERAATEKHEFFDGVVLAMAGETFAHFQLASRMLRALAEALKGRGCKVGGSDLKVKNAAANSYVYPDVVVLCDQPRFDDEQRDVLLNPTAVVEVLSPSTEALDRGKKAQVYRGIASLQVLAFVSQDQPRVEWYERAGDFWVLHEAVGLQSNATLQPLQATLALADLYDGIDFDAATAGQS